MQQKENKPKTGKIILLAAFALVMVVFVLFACSPSEKKNKAASSGETSETAENGKTESTADDNEGTASLTAVVTAEELAQFDELYPELREADLSGSACIEAIAEYIVSHPDVKVTYTVPIGGQNIASDEALVEISSSDECADLLENAIYITGLKDVNVKDYPENYADILRLLELYPSWNIHYTAECAGISADENTEYLDLSGITDSDADEMSGMLAILPKLSSVKITGSDGENRLSPSSVAKLVAAAPEASFDYRFELFGQNVSATDERLEYVDVDIGNEGLEQFREILPCMNRLTYLKLDRCEVTSEEMAKLRDDFPDIKVVWRVYFSSYGECGDGTFDTYNCLTDTEKIWATGTLSDAYAKELMYCTDVKYMDLGHNCITNVDFINYMPKLEVAVLSITWIENIDPLANCPNLEFLEIYSTYITDVSPLANCKNLKHLNLGNNLELTDISALYDLDLERLFVNVSPVPAEQLEHYQELHPDCEVNYKYQHPVHVEWRYEPGYNIDSEDATEHYNERYALLREQIGYDTLDYSK